MFNEPLVRVKLVFDSYKTSFTVGMKCKINHFVIIVVTNIILYVYLNLNTFKAIEPPIQEIMHV